MSHFECRLNRRFWHSKEVVQVFQIRGRRGGRGNLDKIQKNSNFFFRETFPYKVRQFGKVKVHLDNLATFVVNISSLQKIIAPPINDE